MKAFKFWFIYVIGFAVVSVTALSAHELLGKNYSNSESIFTISFSNFIVVKG